MLRKILPGLISVVLISVCISCNTEIVGTGEVRAHKRNLKEFTSVKLESPANVYINLSDGNNCTIMAQDNIDEAIETKVVDNTLIIFNHRKYYTDEAVDIQINMSSINLLETSGTGNIYCKAPITTKKIALELSGAGSMAINLAAVELDAKISGAGKLELRGSAETANIKLSGAGNVEAEELIINECKVNVSGIGNATVNVNEKLVAKVSGAGNIYYTGKATNIKTDVSGVGTIVPKK